MTLLKINNVSKAFKNQSVLKNINLELAEGEHCVMLGQSGSGKSTLLYMIGALDRPDNGEITFKGQNILKFTDESVAKYRNSAIGFMFQYHFLLPSMTCMNNILLPAKIAEIDVSHIAKRTQYMAKFLGVDHCLSKYPFELSGGEQQRINLIRSLSLNPKLLLCDEPTGNLDSGNSKKVLQLILSFTKEIGCSLLLVTHSNEVSRCIERKITIEDGQIIS